MLGYQLFVMTLKKVQDIGAVRNKKKLLLYQ